MVLQIAVVVKWEKEGCGEHGHLGAFEDGGELPARSDPGGQVPGLSLHVPPARRGRMPAGARAHPELGHLRNPDATPMSLNAKGPRRLAS